MLGVRMLWAGVIGAALVVTVTPAYADLIIPFTHPAMMTRYGWGAVRAQA